MDAGRELDALVAEQVMGWEWYTVSGVNVLLPPNHWMCDRPVLAQPGKHGQEDDIDGLRFHDSSQGGNTMPTVPHYSADIAAAWSVVEKMKKDLWAMTVTNLFDGRSFHLDKYKCRLTGFDEEIIAEASTAPLAICLAALKARGIA